MNHPNIDPMTLSIGDVIYTVDAKHTWRDKIWKVDPDGIKWFRYDKDLVEYKINELTLIGRITPTIEGAYIKEHRESFLTYVETIFSYSDGGFLTYTDEIDLAFNTREEAEEYVKNRKEEDERL